MCNKKTFLFFFFFTSFFIVLFSISFLFCITSCFSKDASTTKTSITNEPYNTELSEIVLPKYHGFVNDFTNTLDKDWLAKTEHLVLSVEKETACEIAVAVVDSLQGLTVEEYAVRLFNEWGVGKKEEDNGVLLLVALDERQLRIEVGYGLEGTITDIEAKKIIDDVIVPRFKADDYNSGIYNGAVAIANRIYGEYGKAQIAYTDTVESAAAKRFVDTEAFNRLIISIVLVVTCGPWAAFGGFIGITFLITYIKEHKCPDCKRLGLTVKQTVVQRPNYVYPGKSIIEKFCRYCGYYEKLIVAIPKLSRALHTTSSTGSSSSWSSSSGSSSSSHSSSSFGGGSSGGGGASGRW